MKKCLSVAIATLMLLSMVACGEQDVPTAAPIVSAEPTVDVTVDQPTVEPTVDVSVDPPTLEPTAEPTENPNDLLPETVDNGFKSNKNGTHNVMADGNIVHENDVCIYDIDGTCYYCGWNRGFRYPQYVLDAYGMTEEELSAKVDAILQNVTLSFTDKLKKEDYERVMRITINAEGHLIDGDGIDRTVLTEDGYYYFDLVKAFLPEELWEAPTINEVSGNQYLCSLSEYDTYAEAFKNGGLDAVDFYESDENYHLVNLDILCELVNPAMVAYENAFPIFWSFFCGNELKNLNPEIDFLYEAFQGRAERYQDYEYHKEGSRDITTFAAK